MSIHYLPTAVTCDAIGIQNGKMEYTHFDYMGMASVTCNEGYAYDKPDSKIRHCIANNVWSGESGSCEGKWISFYLSRQNFFIAVSLLSLKCTCLHFWFLFTDL